MLMFISVNFLVMFTNFGHIHRDFLTLNQSVIKYLPRCTYHSLNFLSFLPRLRPLVLVVSTESELEEEVFSTLPDFNLSEFDFSDFGATDPLLELVLLARVTLVRGTEN